MLLKMKPMSAAFDATYLPATYGHGLNLLSYHLMDTALSTPFCLMLQSDLFAGVVALAPMVSLEKVKKQPVNRFLM